MKSKRASERVMKSISKFITCKMKLRVNEEKSCVSHPWWRSFLGFSVTRNVGNTRIRIFSKSFIRFKDRVRDITGRNKGRSQAQVIKELNGYLRGWWNYYRITETQSFLRPLNYWVLRRLRSLLWKQWKNPRTKVRNLKARGVSHSLAVSTGNSRKGPWRISRCQAMQFAYPKRYFENTLGVFILSH